MHLQIVTYSKIKQAEKNNTDRNFIKTNCERRVFLLTGNKEINFFEFRKTHAVVCHALVEAGLSPGDCVQGEDGTV